MNFQYRNNVTLLGGGESSPQTLEKALTHAPHLVAVDGGAGVALGFGHMPERVIGDMDSLDDTTRASLPRDIIHQISEQDSTDFDKALRSVTSPVVLGVGFLGGRLDHELACLNTLVRRPDKTCILLGEIDLCFHMPQQITLDLPPGSRVSLFPLAKVRVHGTGLVHKVDGLTMQPAGQIGTSNTVGPDGQVDLSCDQPGLLVILPRAALPVIISALTSDEPDLT